MASRERQSGTTPAVRLDRWKTYNDFVDNGFAPLGDTTGSPSAALVWFALFRLASGKTGRVSGASMSRLAKLTGLTRKTVAIAVRQLLDGGYLFVDRPGTVPVYVLAHVEKGSG